MSWLENSWDLLRLGISLFARPSITVLNPQPHLEITSAQALDLAQAGEFKVLQKAQFSIPAQTLEARAFWLNLYNALTLHAIQTAQVKSSVLELAGFYARFAYRVQGEVFTLNDIEHGVLRNNRAMIWQPPFRASDPRATFSLPLDPRIHFALNCGAASCPPIRYYLSGQLENQLELATANYMQDCRHESGNVWLPRLFLYYRKDFGQPLKFVRKYRPDLPVDAKVKYLPYTWKR